MLVQGHPFGLQAFVNCVLASRSLPLYAVAQVSFEARDKRELQGALRGDSLIGCGELQVDLQQMGDRQASLERRAASCLLHFLASRTRPFGESAWMPVAGLGGFGELNEDHSVSLLKRELMYAAKKFFGAKRRGRAGC